MYWVAPVPDGALTFSADGKTATLVMKNVPVVDQPKWPAMDAEATPAFMDYKLQFKAGSEPVKNEDATRMYRFAGFKASVQLEATVRVPSIGFEWKSDPLETSKADFGVMGEEVNGKYYSP
ncbi:MAG: hypothetical protein LAO06_03735 [Acidobacteriia bacterium]|nr:hypothetical protein [Terriglobia bacterium]